MIMDFADDDRADLWIGVRRAASAAELLDRRRTLRAECARAHRGEVEANARLESAKAHAIGLRTEIHGGSIARQVSIRVSHGKENLITIGRTQREAWEQQRG